MSSTFQSELASISETRIFYLLKKKIQPVLLPGIIFPLPEVSLKTIGTLRLIGNKKIDGAAKRKQPLDYRRY